MSDAHGPEDNRPEEDRRAENRKAGCTVYGLITLIAWAVLTFLWFRGKIHMHWLLVILAPIWMALAALVLCALSLFLLSLVGSILQKLITRSERKSTWKALSTITEGYVLNRIGPVYGVTRTRGESNRAYRRRIRRSVLRTEVEKVEEVIDSFGDIDRIGRACGVIRAVGEIDSAYRERIIRHIREEGI